MDAENEKKRPRIGVAVLVMQEGKVLLGKRMGSHGEGDWACPGGHLEFGESVEQCAMRELAEETGLTAQSIRLGPWTNDVFEERKHYITFFVFVDRFAGDLQLLEPHKCQSWEWFSWNELPSPLFLPIRSLIQKVGHEKLNESIEAFSIELKP
ncbi:MAG: NUDIX hydrolase [Chlamydiota bacterium]